MTKEDRGIVDFLVRNMSVQKVEDLLLILSEKLHNLETIEKMGDSKMIEFYNLAISLMAAGLRTPAKKLLRKFFSYYLHKRGEETEANFLNILTDKRKTDEIYYKSYKDDFSSNDNNENIEQLAHLIKKINPNIVQLYSIARIPSEYFVYAIDEKRKKEIVKIFREIINNELIEINYY